MIYVDMFSILSAKQESDHIRMPYPYEIPGTVSVLF